jgi:hypothetical protein
VERTCARWRLACADRQLSSSIKTAEDDPGVAG